MEIQHIAIDRLRAAEWNPNIMTPEQLGKLRKSIEEFGITENLVARPLGSGSYEVLSGNQRLGIYQKLGLETAPCVVVELSDARAKLLSQVLNRLRGEDDLGLRAKLVEDLLAELDRDELLAYLPASKEELDALVAMRHSTLEEAFRYWEEKVAQGLHEFQVVLDDKEYRVVREALAKATRQMSQSKASRLRAKALSHICQAYLEGV
jgi:ParB family chromosome partitioning protein